MLDSTCFAEGRFLSYLTCVLNSKIGHYLLKDSPKTGTGDLIISVQAIEPLKIPLVADDEKYSKLIRLILLGDKEIETIAFESISDLYGFTLEERNFISSK